MLLLALLFLVIPIVELYVIIQVAHAIGVFDTLGLLVLDSLLGGWLMKREGMGVLRRLQAKLATGELPSTELVDGFLILFGGALMLAPGFLTDVLGMALLLPPVRAVARRLLARRFKTTIISRGSASLGDVIDL